MEAARLDRADLRTAAALSGGPSSDFDLNPDVKPLSSGGMRSAGVLVPIIERPSGLQLVLTKRASHLKHHPGQVAFPGGRQDETDSSVIDAALREATEEIGLPRDIVDVLGTLPPHKTVSNYEMTPVLGWIRQDFEPVLEVAEVAECFEVPLAFALDESNFRVESRIWQGQRRYFYVTPYGPYYIWGATARVLRGLAERVSRAANS